MFWIVNSFLINILGEKVSHDFGFSFFPSLSFLWRHRNCIHIVILLWILVNIYIESSLYACPDISSISSLIIVYETLNVREMPWFL